MARARLHLEETRPERAVQNDLQVLDAWTLDIDHTGTAKLALDLPRWSSLFIALEPAPWKPVANMTTAKSKLKFPDRKISDTLLQFAEPLFDGLGPHATEKHLERALKLA